MSSLAQASIADAQKLMEESSKEAAFGYNMGITWYNYDSNLHKLGYNTYKNGYISYILLIFFSTYK